MGYVKKNKMIPFVLLVLSFNGLESEASGVSVQEVKIGDTVKLKCPSNDETHRFQYWELINDEIIGPWNNFGNRVKYEVTTGDLTIKEVSPEESGFYKCISKSLTGANLNVKTVELVVNRDWEEEFDDDSVINVYRGLIAFFCVLIFLFLGMIAFVFERRRRSRGYSQGREELQEEALIRSGGTYRPTTTSSYSSERKKRKASGEALIGDTLDKNLSNSFPLPDYE